MIGDQSLRLSIPEQRHLAAWCQRKALTLDAWYPDRFLPANLLHRFSNSCQPLMSSIVDIARLPPPNVGVGTLRGRTMMQVEAPGFDKLDAIRVGGLSRDFFDRLCGPSAGPRTTDGATRKWLLADLGSRP